MTPKAKRISELKRAQTELAKPRSVQRVVRRLVKALRLSIAIIRNDAGVDFHHPNKSKTRMRWCKEIESEAGLIK